MARNFENIGAGILLVTAWLFCVAMVGIPEVSDGLDGVWINAQGTRKAEFTKKDDRYTGTIIWVADGEDKVKPGDIIFKDLEKKGNEYHGFAVTPRFGDIKCVIAPQGDEKIQITVSGGFRSKSVTWTKSEK